MIKIIIISLSILLLSLSSVNAEQFQITDNYLQGNFDIVIYIMNDTGTLIVPNKCKKDKTEIECVPLWVEATGLENLPKAADEAAIQIEGVEAGCLIQYLDKCIIRGHMLKVW